MKRLIILVTIFGLTFFANISYAQNAAFPFLKVGNKFAYECYDGFQTVYATHIIVSKDKNGFYGYKTILNNNFDLGITGYFYADTNSFSNFHRTLPGGSTNLTLYTLDCKEGDSWQVSVPASEGDDRWDHGIFQTNVISVSGDNVHVKMTSLNEPRVYQEYYIDKKRGVIKFTLCEVWSADDEEEFKYATYVLSSDVKEKLRVDIGGCDNVVIGESVLLPVSYYPEGGKVRYWVEGKGITVSDGGRGVTVTGTQPGEGTVWAEYTAGNGEKVKSSKAISSVRLNSINQGEPLQIGLYDVKGQPIKTTKKISVKVEPSNKWDELNYRAADDAIVSATPSNNSRVAVQGLRKGKTIIQAFTKCNSKTGPELNVEIVNCDDDVIKELKFQAKQMESRMKSNLSQQSEALNSKDFEESDKNGTKAIIDVSTGLVGVALTFTAANGGVQTAALKLAKLGSDINTVHGNASAQNGLLSTWQLANMTAAESVGKTISGALKTAVELASATADLGSYLGSSWETAKTLKDLAERLDQTQKELEAIQHVLYQVCGRDEVHRDPTEKGDDSPPADPKTTPSAESKSTPSAESKSTPPTEPKSTPPTESKTTPPTEPKTTPPTESNTPPTQTDKSSEGPKTSAGGIMIDLEDKCGCTPYKSDISIGASNSNASGDLSRLMGDISSVESCFTAFAQTRLNPLIKSMKMMEAFYAELEKFNKLKDEEREKRIEILKTLFFDIEIEDLQNKISAINDFSKRYGGLATKIQNDIKAGLKVQSTDKVSTEATEVGNTK